MDEKTVIDTIESMQSTIADKDRIIGNYQLQNEIRERKGAEKRKQKKGREFHFTKAFTAAIRNLLEKRIINYSEQVFLFNVQVYLSYETNYIVDKQEQRMNIEDISKLIGWKRNHTTNVINGLVDKGILIKEKTGRQIVIRVNSKYFFRGIDNGSRNLDN